MDSMQTLYDRLISGALRAETPPPAQGILWSATYTFDDAGGRPVVRTLSIVSGPHVEDVQADLHSHERIGQGGGSRLRVVAIARSVDVHVVGASVRGGEPC